MPTVTFDNVSNLGTGNTTAGVSASFGIGATATALLVTVGGTGVAYSSLTTLTATVGVGNQAVSLVANILPNNTSADGWVALFELLAPPTGTQTITVRANNGATPANINVTAISFSGVGQFGTPVVNYGTNATINSGNIVSSTGNRVLTIAGGIDATLTLTGSGTQRSNQPSPAQASYVTLLLQDQAGASTVSNTASFSGSSGWGTISVNLIAGNLYSVGTTLSLTTSTSQSASFVGQVWHVGASLSLSVVPTVVGVDQPLGPPLRYVGRAPDTDSVLVPASYAGTDEAQNLVTPAWLTQQITQASQFLVTSDWIQGQINGTGVTPIYLSQSAVTTALGGYIPNTALGASNGLAQLNGTGLVPSGQLPTLTTNNVAKCYDSIHNGTNFLASNTTFTVITQSIGEFVLANVVIPDPGYPWVPLPFAYVVGYSSGGTPSGNRLSGTGNFGALYVTAAGQTSPVYGMGICTDDPLANYHVVVPGCLMASGAVTPLTQQPINGGATLQLSGCNWTEADYTFEGSGLIFFVLVVPGLL